MKKVEKKILEREGVEKKEKNMWIEMYEENKWVIFWSIVVIGIIIWIASRLQR